MCCAHQLLPVGVAQFQGRPAMHTPRLYRFGGECRYSFSGVEAEPEEVNASRLLEGDAQSHRPGVTSR